MLLTSLTDGELLRHAQAEHEPLIASSLEVELLRRFDQLYLEHDEDDALQKVLDEYQISTPTLLTQWLEQPKEFGGKNIGELTDLLAEFDLDTLDALRKVLERDGKVTQILADITQPINTLAEMANAQ